MRSGVGYLISTAPFWRGVFFFQSPSLYCLSKIHELNIKLTVLIYHLSKSPYKRHRLKSLFLELRINRKRSFKCNPRSTEASIPLSNDKRLCLLRGNYSLQGKINHVNDAGAQFKGRVTFL